MPESLKQKSVKGVLWSFGGRSCVQLVQFVISIILARLLSPEDYGVVGLAYVAIALEECFADLGIGGAVIQQKEVDELDYNTCFWAEASVRLLVFGIIFFSAPYFAAYYKRPILIKLIRVIVLSGLIGIIRAVPNLKLRRAMDFKTPSWTVAIGAIIGGVTALVCAFYGLGMWALVVQNLGSSVISALLLLWRCPFCPHFQFSWRRFCVFINFGYKLLFTGILDCLYNNLSGLIIGKAFSVEALGFYSKGCKLPRMSMNTINGPINGVAFPMFSRLQDAPEKCRIALRQSLMTSLFFVAPFMTGLAIVAHPLVLLLFGEKWLPAVPYLRIMAIVYAFYPIHTLNLGAIIGNGRSDLILKLEIIKKINGAILMFAFIPLGLFWFVCSHILSAIVGILVNTFPLKGLLGYSTWTQMTDISKSLLGSIVMAVFLLSLNFLKWNALLVMGIQIPLGALVYLSYYYLFNRAFLKENLALMKRILHKH